MYLLYIGHGKLRRPDTFGRLARDSLSWEMPPRQAHPPDTVGKAGYEVAMAAIHPIAALPPPPPQICCLAERAEWVVGGETVTLGYFEILCQVFTSDFES